MKHLITAFMICVSAVTALAAENTLTPSEKEQGWRLLFDGKSTTGWRGFQKQTFPDTGWTVEDGCLKCLAKKGGDIITTEKFTDFALTWEWRLAPMANSGVKYFVDENRGGTNGKISRGAIAHEYQMIDDDHYPQKLPADEKTGAWYDVVPPKDAKPKPVGEFNHSSLIVQGNHVEHWLNGVRVVAYDTNSAESAAAIASSKFKTVPGFADKIPTPILFQDHDSIVWLRNIKIRALAQTTPGATPVPNTAPRGALPLIFNMIHDNPGEKPFETKYRDPLVLKDMGYNGKVMKTFPQTALTYAAFDPEIMPEGSPARVWADDYAKTVDKQIAAAKAAGMPIYNFTDVLVVPETLLVKYGNEMTVGKGEVTKENIERNRKNAINGSLEGSGRRLSITRPMTQRVLKAQLDELFTRFPDLDGIFLRFGETYLHDTPFHVGGSPVGGGAGEHRILLGLLREEVCVKHNKKLFYRTWGWDGLLTDPGFYGAVTNAIEPHPNLIFSIKHSNGDFTRDVPFNKTLGVGNHAQIVEVSCNQAGLYGKCAHPYYIGKGVIDGWDNHGKNARGLRSLLDNKNIVGIWTWSHGDGWVGPYKTNELWTDLNAAVMVGYARNPGRPESEIFAEYCRGHLKLDGTQSAKFRDLCLLATEATYHGQETAGGNSWWCRDEYLTAINLGGPVAKGNADKLLAEKAQAVADWKRVEAMAREIKLNNPADQEFLEVSSTYGRIKIAIIEQIWTLQILAAQAKTSATHDKPAMAKALATYDSLWAEWRKLKEDHACCPTLYRDDKAVYCGPPLKPVLDNYRDIVAGDKP